MKGAATTITKFLALPGGERRLVARALYLVAAYRMALYVMPPSRFRALAGNLAGRSRFLSQFPPERLAWAVRAASRRLPGATCLTQSLALHRLLAKSGHPAEIRVGVAKGERGGLESHAWVVCHGRVLSGDDGDLGRFEPILSLGTGRA